jgi:ABC-type glycerol-3-phosphate transport system permease component
MIMATIRRDSGQLLPRGLRVPMTVVLCVFALAPIAYMVIMSLAPDVEVASGRLFPQHFAFGNYVHLWTTVPLARGLVNSLATSLGAAALSTVVAVGAAYCLTRFTFIGRRTFLRGMLGLQTIPSALILLPLFVTFASAKAYLNLTIVGTRSGLLITYLTFALPFAIWLMVTYLRSIPEVLEEAALVDGLTRVGALWRVILPLSLPGIVVSTIFSFLLGWNDVLFAGILTRPDTRTAAIDLQVFAQAQEGGPLPLYGQLLGASVICAVPVVLLYMFFQRYLVGGLASGGVKG